MPLLFFIGSHGIATILSIDFHTSLLGYYSRFNGGFLSILCYALLYWAWVSTMSRKQTIITCYLLLVTAIPVCIYGILQHFGIDKDIWVQDVQNRIFSTLGQPNWLAAWVVALLPLTWSLSLRASSFVIPAKAGNYTDKSSVSQSQPLSSKLKVKSEKLQFKIQSFLPLILSSLLFITVLYTKSRSGLLAFAIEFLVFWGFIVFTAIKNRAKIRTVVFALLPFAFLLFTLIAVIGTPWTKSILHVSNTKYQILDTEYNSTTTSLESGGTESGEIRKIVWQGAFDIWKNYPIFGTGVETFAFAYYQFKPEAHNYTSEWDYLYNKAHNEYLNYLSTTGVVGLVSYLVLIVFVFYQFKIQNEKLKVTIQNSKLHTLDKLSTFNCNFELCTLNLALVSGFTSILITNFFGFSVVPVSLLFFLFPAFAISLSNNEVPITKQKDKSFLQKVGLLFVICNLLFVISRIADYYSADLSYSNARAANKSKDFVLAREEISKAIEKSPNEAVFWDESSYANRNIATFLAEKNDIENAKKFADFAIEDGRYGILISPSNVNLKRNFATTLTLLSTFDQNYLLEANKILNESIALAPTDPKLQYAYAASFYRLGQLDKAIEEMKKAVDMKTDYKDSRYALALMYIDAKKNDEAKKELQYILENIDPESEEVEKELEELK